MCDALANINDFLLKFEPQKETDLRVRMHHRAVQVATQVRQIPLRCFLL